MAGRSFRSRLELVLVAGLGLATACGIEHREGWYECDFDSPTPSCPNGWFCRADGTCWSTPGDGGVDLPPHDADADADDALDLPDVPPDRTDGESDDGPDVEADDGSETELDDGPDVDAADDGDAEADEPGVEAESEAESDDGAGCVEETCNELDDDCDGATDVSTAFSTHPHEPNDSCAALTDLGNARAPVTGMSVSDAPTLYPDGDLDYYTLFAQEPTDAFWDCIPYICEERYTVTITLTRPPDGAAYQLCASASDCGAQTCTSGATVTLNWTGTCGGTDDRRIWFSVRSPGGGQFDCHAYDVRVSFDARLVDTSMWPDCPGV